MNLDGWVILMCEVPLYLQPPATPTHTHGPQWHSFHRFEKFRVCHEGGGELEVVPSRIPPPTPQPKTLKPPKPGIAKRVGKRPRGRPRHPPVLLLHPLPA